MLPAEQNQDADWIIREDPETDWDHGRRPEQRSIEERLENGLILIDKPAGPTSHQVSMWTSEILERDKTGHSGTLDPQVTGVLPIGLNDGTKVLQALTAAGKVYVGGMEIEDERTKAEIAAAVPDVIGTRTQTPPEKSAVKREPREREIYDLAVLEVDGTQILFRIECEKGFYVRNFCQNFAQDLGTTGEMTDLRRTQVGVFEEGQLHSLQDVVDAYEFWKDGKDNRLEEMILPVEAGVRHLKKVLVKDSAVASICHGADLGVQGIAKLQDGIEDGEMVALLTLKGELIALADAEMTSQEMAEESGTATDLRRVFMEKDIYPKGW